MANLVSRFVQKIFLDDARQEDVAEESSRQQNDGYVEVVNDVNNEDVKNVNNIVKNDNNNVKLELNSSYTILRPEAVKEVLVNEKEKNKKIEDDAPINPAEFRKLPKSYRVKFFTLGKASDYETIAAELYTQDLIGLVNINPLKKHSQPLVVNVLTKFKGLTQEINGDIGALRNGWIIITPNNVEVYKKKETAVLQENTSISRF